jgi:hypothetical protein
MFVDTMRDDNSDITEIQRGSCDVEYRDDGLCGPDTDEVEAAAEGNNKPYRVDGRLSYVVDFAPESVRIR